jgi:hypothetical protein
MDLHAGPTVDSICTCLFYIYFCIYSYLCLGELVLVFWNLLMVRRVIIDPSLDLKSLCDVVPPGTNSLQDEERKEEKWAS